MMDLLITPSELFCLAIIFNLDLGVWHSLFLDKYREIDHKT